MHCLPHRHSIKHLLCAINVDVEGTGVPSMASHGLPPNSSTQHGGAAQADDQEIDAISAQKQTRLCHRRKHAQPTGMQWYRVGPLCGLGGVARGSTPIADPGAAAARIGRCQRDRRVSGAGARTGQRRHKIGRRLVGSDWEAGLAHVLGLSAAPRRRLLRRPGFGLDGWCRSWRLGRGRRQR
jgi:hypothetical protein